MQAYFSEAGEVLAVACNNLLDNQPVHNANLELFSAYVQALSPFINPTVHTVS